MDVASKLVKAFTDHHAHSVYFKYSAEGWFTFGAFAAAFMIKVRFLPSSFLPTPTHADSFIVSSWVRPLPARLIMTDGSICGVS